MSIVGRLAAASGVLGRLRTAWKRDVRCAVDPLRADINRLTRQIDALARQMEAMQATVKEGAARAKRADRQAEQLRLMVHLNEKHHKHLARLPAVLDAPSVVQHVRRAILDTPLQRDPYPHVVVNDVLPAAVYNLVLESIPPAVFFGDRDPIKQNLRIPIDFAPALTCRVWSFVDDVIAREAIVPAVMALFRDDLSAHYERLFGAEFRDRAAALPQSTSGGRVMLRRPGYYLAPHRDPKRSMVTCLLYLASRRDSEEWGTEIYRVVDDGESSFAQTYYPEQEGRRCELVKKVPYRPNSMLVFLNSYGAHGARIPEDAPPDLERFSYQFYVGPEAEALDALVQDLPAERQAMWGRKRAG